MTAQQQQQQQDQSAAQSDLVAVQRRRFDATLSGDIAALERLLSDDLTYIHAGAHVDTKATFIASIREGRASFKGFAVEDQQVRVFGDTGVITGIVRITLRGAEQDRVLHTRCTDVWVHRPGGWQEVAWQTSRIAE